MAPAVVDTVQAPAFLTRDAITQPLYPGLEVRNGDQIPASPAPLRKAFGAESPQQPFQPPRRDAGPGGPGIGEGLKPSSLRRPPASTGDVADTLPLWGPAQATRFAPPPPAAPDATPNTLDAT